MALAYNTLSYAQQQIYKDIESKIGSFCTEFVYQNTSFDTVSDVFKAVLEDHPEYFWLSGASSGTIKTMGSLSTVYFRPEFTVSCSVFQLRIEKSRFDAKVSELILLAKRKSSVLYEQILFLHDYLVLHTDYRDGAPHCYDAYGCLILGKAVCAGYTAAFQVLMNRLGVECGRVRGSSATKMTGEVSHVWNYIKLTDGYYFVDVTWDDPILNNGASGDNLSHEYFCLNLQELRLTHRLKSDQFIPGSYGTRFNYYRYMGLYAAMYSFATVRDIAVRQLNFGNKFSVKFGSSTQLNLAVKDLMDNQKVYSIPGIKNRIAYGISISGLILSVTVK